MGIDDYKKLAASYGGQYYGNTSQISFIAKYNVSNAPARFLENISNYLLKNDRQSKQLLEWEGICNGLCQSLYLALSQAKDKEKAIAQFAKKLDDIDLTLAGQANSFQKIGDDYENVHHSSFRKTLGLDLMQRANYNPYQTNDAVDKIMNQVRKYFSTEDQTISADEPVVDNSVSQDKIFSDMINFIIHLPKEEFVRITLNFMKDSHKILQDSLGGHAIMIYRFTKEGKDAFVFYDPNGLPTVFDDVNSLQNFSKAYLDQIATKFRRMFNILQCDNVSFDIWEYAVDHHFHQVINHLIPAIKDKIFEQNQFPASDPKLLRELRLLLKRCILAVENNQYYSEPSHLGKELRELLSEKIASLFDEGKPFHSTQELLKFIENDIQHLSSLDEKFAESLLKFFDQDQPSQAAQI